MCPGRKHLCHILRIRRWPTEGGCATLPVHRTRGEEPGTAGPGDEVTAGPDGHSLLRTSHGEREQIIGVLEEAAFAQGRLDKNEFDLRVGQALASQT